jgi:hypothetical protein
MSNMLRLMSLVAFAAVAGNAHALPCAGFTDVDSTSPFCPNVEWLKNRAVTTGCTSATLYCPTDPVSRLSMAVFMNRLGKALSPQILKRHGALGATNIPGESPDPALLVCVTDATTATYPRAVLLNASFTGLADAGAVAYRVFWLYSDDNGTTWQAIQEGNPPASINSPRASSAANQWSGVSLTYAGDYLEPNVLFKFAIGIRRDNVLTGTTGNFAGTRCQLTATLFNANPTTPPY